jgi:hypothetical protein
MLFSGAGKEGIIGKNYAVSPGFKPESRVSGSILNPGWRGAGSITLRGGSWNNNQRNARVAVRNHNQPDNFNNNNGFRVVVAPNFLWPRGKDLAGKAVALRSAAGQEGKIARSGPGRGWPVSLKFG